ncbi:MAG: hypothetical protein HQL64_12730 [Magnetococcales bacterium]|nr:hypothetical protein [Magnetococcales bacterium]
MKRPYKDEWPVEKAMEVLRRESGLHFDPRMVGLFHGILPEILQIKESFGRG